MKERFYYQFYWPRSFRSKRRVANRGELLFLTTVLLDWAAAPLSPQPAYQTPRHTGEQDCGIVWDSHGIISAVVHQRT